MLFGYARPSTTDQAAGLAAQEQTLKAFGVERIFTEPGSSLANCPVLKTCLEFLRENDALIVTTADRLARSVTDLLAIIADLDTRGIELVILSLDGQVFGTRHPDSKLTRRILAGVADWERAIMFERQRGGITRARAEGRYKGRPRRINPDEVRALAGTMSVLAIARTLNISRSSTYRMLQQTARKP